MAFKDRIIAGWVRQHTPLGKDITVIVDGDNITDEEIADYRKSCEANQMPVRMMYICKAGSDAMRVTSQ